jgi:hypothetical protein
MTVDLVPQKTIGEIRSSRATWVPPVVVGAIIGAIG